MNANRYGRVSILRAASVNAEDRTILKNVYFTAPFKLLPPHEAPPVRGKPETAAALVTQLSVSPGVMAGDRQEISLHIGAGSAVIWTTQSFEKIQAMKEGEWAERVISINISEGAFLHYRPRPVIPFAASDFRGAISINLESENAALIYSDILCAGRAAMGEVFLFRRYRQMTEIRLKGKLIYRDNLDLIPENFHRFGAFENYTHSASMILYNAGGSLQEIRELLNAPRFGNTARAATAISEGTILIRAFAHSAEALEQVLRWVADAQTSGAHSSTFSPL